MNIPIWQFFNVRLAAHVFVLEPGVRPLVQEKCLMYQRES